MFSLFDLFSWGNLPFQYAFVSPHLFTNLFFLAFLKSLSLRSYIFLSMYQHSILLLSIRYSLSPIRFLIFNFLSNFFPFRNLYLILPHLHQTSRFLSRVFLTDQILSLPTSFITPPNSHFCTFTLWSSLSSSFSQYFSQQHLSIFRRILPFLSLFSFFLSPFSPFFLRSPYFFLFISFNALFCCFSCQWMLSHYPFFFCMSFL